MKEYPTTEIRDSMVFHSFLRLMRVHGIESCFAPGVHHVRNFKNNISSSSSSNSTQQQNYKLYATALQVHNIEYVDSKCLHHEGTA